MVEPTFVDAPKRYADPCSISNPSLKLLHPCVNEVSLVERRRKYRRKLDGEKSWIVHLCIFLASSLRSILNVSIPRRQFNSIYVTAPPSVKKRIELRNEGWKGSEIKINTISKWSVFMEIIIKLYTYVVIYSTEIRQRSNIYIYKSAVVKL